MLEEVTPGGLRSATLLHTVKTREIYTEQGGGWMENSYAVCNMLSPTSHQYNTQYTIHNTHHSNTIQLCLE